MAALEPIHDEIEIDRLQTAMGGPDDEARPQLLENDASSPANINTTSSD